MSGKFNELPDYGRSWELGFLIKLGVGGIGKDPNASLGDRANRIIEAEEGITSYDEIDGGEYTYTTPTNDVAVVISFPAQVPLDKASEYG